MKWYYREYDQAIGPFEEKEMRALIQQGKIRKNTQVRKDSSQDWQRTIDSDLQAHFNHTEIDENRKKYKWYYMKGGITIGPFTEEEMVKKIKAREVREDMKVKLFDSHDWNDIMKTYLANYFNENK